jgi:arginine/lysine/histidine/glutamine transport system substrate-binding/permease protein
MDFTIDYWRSVSRNTLAAFLMAFLVMPSVAVAHQSKTLLFATDPTFPPFEFSQDGELVGFDVDLIKAIGDAAGFSVKLESVPFDGIIPALKANTYDGAMAAISATDERRKSIEFSKPYFKNGIVIVVPENSALIRSEADLHGKTIAVEIGSVGATKAATIKDAQIRTYNTPNSLLELANGNADAALGDESQVKYAIATGQVRGLKVLPELLSTDFYVVGMPLNSPHTQLINEGLSKVVKSGQYARIYKKWFSTDPPKLD